MEQSSIVAALVSLNTLLLTVVGFFFARLIHGLDTVTKRIHEIELAQARMQAEMTSLAEKIVGVVRLINVPERLERIEGLFEDHDEKIAALRERQHDLADALNGIIHQSGVDVVDVLLFFVFELRHSFEHTDRCDRVQKPHEFCMLGHLGLNENHRLLGVETGGEEVERRVKNLSCQFFRIVGGRNRVKIDDAVITRVGVIVLQPDPVLEGPEIIAEVQFARRLYA